MDEHIDGKRQITTIEFFKKILYQNLVYPAGPLPFSIGGGEGAVTHPGGVYKVL